jgi:hypothetical protein
MSETKLTEEQKAEFLAAMKLQENCKWALKEEHVQLNGLKTLTLSEADATQAAKAAADKFFLEAKYVMAEKKDDDIVDNGVDFKPQTGLPKSAEQEAAKGHKGLVFGSLQR